MAKDPAFLFYSNDFLTGVADLTMEERGQYITLLCLQHQKGNLSEKTIRLCVGNAAADVLAKFSRGEDGLFFNSRLNEEIEKRKLHGEKQRQRAKDGWDKRKNGMIGHSTGNAAALPLEDENEIEDEIKKGIVKENEIQKPDEKNYDLECPEVTIGAAIQMFKYQKKQDVDKETILGLWDVFKKKNFTGQKFYNYTKDIFTHFINDLRTQKISDGKQKLGTSAARMEALRKW